MVTYEGCYDMGVQRLTSLLIGHYGCNFFPVVACERPLQHLVMPRTSPNHWSRVVSL